MYLTKSTRSVLRKVIQHVQECTVLKKGAVGTCKRELNKYLKGRFAMKTDQCSGRNLGARSGIDMVMTNIFLIC